jgi:hypothetical protein
LKKFFVGGIAAAAMAVPAVALAQLPDPVVTTEGKVSNANAGTKSKPTPVKFTFKGVNSAASQTTVSKITLELPNGVKFDGTRLVTCSVARLSGGGPTRCPAASRAGKGIAYAALVNKTAPAPDCPGTRGATPGCLVFDLSFFVGGKRLMSVWLQQSNGDVQSVLQGKISTNGRRMEILIPRSLQAPLQSPAGTVYSALQQLSGSFERKRKVGRRTYSFVSTTGCPAGRQWSTRTTFDYVPNPEAPPVRSRSASSSQTCRK